LSDEPVDEMLEETKVGCCEV